MSLRRLSYLILQFFKYLLWTFFPSLNKENASVRGDTVAIIPESVNYHFTRQCNYNCGFCFHTAKTSYHLPLDEAKKGLAMLKDEGMKKVNFSGGEPFLIQGGKYLGEMVRYSKEELDIESVTVVTNGSRVTKAWMAEYGYYLDIMAVSVDSFDKEVNDKIGRRSGKSGSSHLESLSMVRDWCREYSILFKVNTVVNKHNFQEDMNENIRHLNPVRWKVFQCLPIEAENMGEGALRQVEPFLVTDEEWEHFLNTHSDIGCLVRESNDQMRNSYIILDEYMRFLDNSQGRKEPSRSLLDVGVQAALNKSGFDEKMFLKRGGKYEWSKKDQLLDW